MPSDTPRPETAAGDDLVFRLREAARIEHVDDDVDDGAFEDVLEITADEMRGYVKLFEEAADRIESGTVPLSTVDRLVANWQERWIAERRRADAAEADLARVVRLSAEDVETFRRRVLDLRHEGYRKQYMAVFDRVLAALSASPATPPCHWREGEDGILHTDCGHEFVTIDGTPLGNSFKFCVYCGRTLKAMPTLENA